jgi:hypothetical protein
MPWRTSHVQSEAIHAYLDMSSNKLTPFLTLVTDPDPELDLLVIFSVSVCTFYEPVDSPSLVPPSLPVKNITLLYVETTCLRRRNPNSSSHTSGIPNLKLKERTCRSCNIPP